MALPAMFYSARDRSLVLASIAAPLMCALLLGAPGFYQEESISRGNAPLSFALAAAAFIFSLLAEVFFGWPLVWLGYRTGMIRWWSAASGGVLAALIVDAALRAPYSLPQLDEAAGIGFVGAVSGFSFWLVWTDGRLTGRAGHYLKLGLFVLLALAASWAMYAAGGFVWPAKTFPTPAPSSIGLSYVLASLQGCAGAVGPLVAVVALTVWAGRDRANR